MHVGDCWQLAESRVIRVTIRSCRRHVAEAVVGGVFDAGIGVSDELHSSAIVIVIAEKGRCIQILSCTNRADSAGVVIDERQPFAVTSFLREHLARSGLIDRFLTRSVCILRPHRTTKCIVAILCDFARFVCELGDVPQLVVLVRDILSAGERLCTRQASRVEKDD